MLCVVFFFNATPATGIYTLSLHDALPIWFENPQASSSWPVRGCLHLHGIPFCLDRDRKSTRLNSSHMSISYAVFCLKKKRPSIRLYSTPSRCKRPTVAVAPPPHRPYIRPP